MSRNYYTSGDWNLICDVCSVKIKASKTKRRWDGFQVCPSCFETRHPQDFVRARQDKISVPFTRPRPPDVFTVVLYDLYVLDGYYINPPNQQYIEEDI